MTENVELIDSGDTSDDDEVFDALADGQRRQLLLELRARERYHVARLTGVSREIADADEELLARHLSAARRITGADEELLQKRLVHLPKLAEYGFIEWDRDEHVVTRGPRFDELRPVLEVIADRRHERQLQGLGIPLPR